MHDLSHYINESLIQRGLPQGVRVSLIPSLGELSRPDSYAPVWKGPRSTS